MRSNMQKKTICGTFLAACAALFIDMAVAVSQEAATPDDETTKVLEFVGTRTPSKTRLD